MICAAAAFAIHPVVAIAGFEPEVWLRFVGRLHPLVVHFPIALLLVALMAECVGAVRHPQRRSRVAVVCLLLGTLGAILAAWFGWINADHEPYGRAITPILEMHRVLGVATAIIATLTSIIVFIDRDRTRGWAMYGYRFGLFAGVILVSFGSHIGGQMVYGVDYLTEVFRTPSTEERFVSQPILPPVESTPITRTGVTFVDDVLPIFEANCNDCHGPRRQKAGLRLDQAAAIFQGSRDFWVVEPGDAEASVLFERISLPNGHLDLMPADADRLPDHEIETIRRWIDQGASGVLDDANSNEPPEVAELPELESLPANNDGVPFGLRPLSDDALASQVAAIRRVRENGGAAAYVSNGTAAVDVNLSVVGSDVDGDALDMLNGLESSLVWLDLSGTSLTDRDLESLNRFPHLRRLHLSRTSIGDAGLESLAKLRRLEYLNLYGTNVTDAGILRLVTLGNLERLYVWDTDVTEQAIAVLRDRLPRVEIIGETSLDVSVEAADADAADADAEDKTDKVNEAAGG